MIKKPDITDEFWDLDTDGTFYPSGEVYEGEHGWTIYPGEWQVFCVVMDAEIAAEEGEEHGEEVWYDWIIYPTEPLEYSIISEENEVNILKEQIRKGELDDWSSDLLGFLVWAHNTTAEDIARDILNKYFTKEEREIIKKFLRETYNITY